MPEMKDSGIPGINQIPVSWKTTKLYCLLYEVTDLYYSTMEGLPLLSVSEYYGVADKKSKIDEGDFLSRADTFDGYKKCKKGDMVSNIMLAWKGALGESPINGIVSPAYCVYRPYEGVNTHFLQYLLRTQAYCDNYRVRSSGIIMSRLRLYSPQFLHLDVVLPLSDEQQRITSFLDSKCAEIDVLIADIEKEIALLEEYKKSVITEAVTKGLDPSVEMKDTQDTWIRSVPKHWKFVKAGNLFVERVVKANGMETPLSLSQKDGLVRTDEMVEHAMKSKTYEGWKKVWPNDLVLNRFKAHLGVFFCSKYEGMVSFHYGVYIAKEKMNVKFYEYLFHSKPYCDMFAELSNGITVGLQNLGNSTFYAAKCVYPSFEEQNRIVEYLDNTCKEIGYLIHEKEFQLTLLADYKKSLIYEYVTGKKEVSQ